MNPESLQNIAGTPADPPESEATGLPGFRSWGAVYGFVLATFVIWVGLLTALSEMFS
jgi:hypothetical protein